MSGKTSRLILLCLFLCLSVCAVAGEKDSTDRKMIHMVGVDFRPAYTFPTNGFFKGVNAAQTPVRKTFSGHVKYGFKFFARHLLGENIRMPYRESEWDIILLQF